MKIFRPFSSFTTSPLFNSKKKPAIMSLWHCPLLSVTTAMTTKTACLRRSLMTLTQAPIAYSLPQVMLREARREFAHTFLSLLTLKPVSAFYSRDHLVRAPIYHSQSLCRPDVRWCSSTHRPVSTVHYLLGNLYYN